MFYSSIPEIPAIHLTSALPTCFTRLMSTFVSPGSHFSLNKVGNQSTMILLKIRNRIRIFPAPRIRILKSLKSNVFFSSFFYKICYSFKCIEIQTIYFYQQFVPPSAKQIFFLIFCFKVVSAFHKTDKTDKKNKMD